MPVMQQVPADHPLMKAWKAYRETEEFRNSFNWATRLLAYENQQKEAGHPIRATDVQRGEWVKGALWAAFMAGFQGAPSKSDFRWLIEAPGTKYLAVQRLTSSATFEWTTDHNKALAFRSEAQADDMIATLRQMDRLHDSYENNGKLSWGKLFAFEPTLGNARAVEHAWV